MTNPNFIIRPITPSEIDKAADILATGYFHDIFFKWSVENDDDRHRILADYYKIYLNAIGCVSHVAENAQGHIIGVSVWLPHDVDADIYDDIDKAAGVYAPQFRAVCDKSHDSEPPMSPFYQLVGFVVLLEARGIGVGNALLKYHLDILDEAGIPTYLEASTPYTGVGVYGHFGYQPVGELMVFADNAVLHPLWRPVTLPPQAIIPHDFTDLQATAATLKTVRFGSYDWCVLDVRDDKVFLLSNEALDLGQYHDTFESVTWADSTIRNHLNSTFYNAFSPEEQSHIVETQVITQSNPWFGIDSGAPSIDKVFLLSIEEVVSYLGDSGQIKNPNNKFFIDDSFNDARQATQAGTSSRWMLRTPGNSPCFVATITIEGKIAMTGDFVNRSSSELFNVGVRPALWVKKQAVCTAC